MEFLELLVGEAFEKIFGLRKILSIAGLGYTYKQEIIGATGSFLFAIILAYIVVEVVYPAACFVMGELDKN